MILDSTWKDRFSAPHGHFDQDSADELIVLALSPKDNCMDFDSENGIHARDSWILTRKAEYTQRIHGYCSTVIWEMDIICWGNWEFEYDHLSFGWDLMEKLDGM